MLHADEEVQAKEEDEGAAAAGRGRGGGEGASLTLCVLGFKIRTAQPGGRSTGSKKQLAVLSCSSAIFI